MAKRNCSIQEARAINRQRNISPSPRRYDDTHWPELRRDRHTTMDFGRKKNDIWNKNLLVKQPH